MRWAGLLIALCPAAALAEEPRGLPVAALSGGGFVRTTPAVKLAPPTVVMEVEPATFNWPPRARPAPAPAPYCPPAATPAVPPKATTPPPTNSDGTPRVPTADEVARQANPANAAPFAVGAEAGALAARSFNDNFNGDFAGLVVCRRIRTGTIPTVVPDLVTFEVATTPDNGIYQEYCNVVGSRYNGILITDNDSPRPTDRAYFGYNYYNGVNPSLNPELGRTDQHRQTVGFEKTFLDGDASIGMRLPFIQTYGPALVGNQGNVGDLSVLFKYAFLNDRATGDLMSVGLVVTTPTGGGNNVVLDDGSTLPQSVLLQPWMGGVKMYSWGYAQIISSYVIPTSTREPVLANNSAAAGYYLYNTQADRIVKSIVPVLELHLRNPLTFRDMNGSVFLQDQFNITTGVHFRSLNATVSPSFTVPTMGPNPFRYEANVWVNYRF